ncbi:unnamed protein product, partial [Staurois parvus]
PRLSITESCPVITLYNPVIAEYYRRGRELYGNNTDLSPGSSCTLLCMALHSRAIQSMHNLIVKQHTVNPLIASHVNPFLPSAISTVSFY